MNLQEHIKKVLREETKEGKYIDMIEDLTEEFKNKDCVCDININYDDEDDMYSVYVVTSTECMSEKFDNSATFILRKINRIRHDIKEEIKSFLPIENIYVGSYGKPNCGWSPLNESEESKQERKFTKLLNNIEEYLNSNSYDSVVRFMVDYDEVMDDVIVNIFFDAEKARELGGGINSVIKRTGKKIVEDLSVFPFDFKYHIHFEKPQLNESENKKSSLLSNIEENGLYEIISSTGLHINEIEQKVGQFSREVIERFIIDVVKEHHTDIDEDGQTYILDLEEYFDVVPIGNNDYVVQLRVTYDKLFFLVDLYDEDEYGDLEYSSHEVEPSKNILYDNIYEIAGQLGFLLVKGRF